MIRESKRMTFFCNNNFDRFVIYILIFCQPSVLYKYAVQAKKPRGGNK